MPRERPTLLNLPLELRLEIYTHLLVLPPPPPRETQQTIYRCSYAHSPTQNNTTTKRSQNKPTLHPQILAVNTQTHQEATPILYSHNTFAAHPIHLTTRPTLYHPYCSPCKPVTTPNLRKNPNQIKKWHLRLRLDVPPPTPTTTPSSSSSSNPPPPPWNKTTITTAFSNADSLTLDLWSGTFTGGVGVDVLRQFEGVRGVRRVRVVGM
ncbi:hypothetical protein C8A00DRAFT_32647, partial [Chaetomidium leptoderma]